MYAKSVTKKRTELIETPLESQTQPAKPVKSHALFVFLFSITIVVLLISSHSIACSFTLIICMGENSFKFYAESNIYKAKAYRILRL